VPVLETGMTRNPIFHPDFQAKPFWWEAYQPTATELAEVPRETRVAIVGGGYAGLATAIELSRHGVEATILEAQEPGFGGSSRNGGMVSGGVHVGRRYSGKNDPAELALLYADAGDSFSVIERIIAEESIACEWKKTGRFAAAWCPQHYRDMAAKIPEMNEHAEAGAYMLPRDKQREEIGSDYYFGGMVVPRSAHLHPALYYQGLLQSAERRGVRICAKAPVSGLTRQGTGWQVTTARGTVTAGDVVIATNGYTGDVTPQLKRRLLPVGSYIIATEELPPEIAAGISPKDRSIYDTRRVLTYYRMSGDRKRLIFGGRAKFGFTDPVDTAPILYQHMTDRFPQLKGCRITHAWTGNVAFTFDEVPHMGQRDGMHYALGCNGSGVAMMTYLGTQVGRKIAGATNRRNAFDREDFPDLPLYSGDSRGLLRLIGPYFRARDWLDRRFG
jgi:glycine/D-amino acid oxidase-like deaminating enzyme